MAERLGSAQPIDPLALAEEEADGRGERLQPAERLAIGLAGLTAREREIVLGRFDAGLVDPWNARRLLGESRRRLDVSRLYGAEGYQRANTTEVAFGPVDRAAVPSPAHVRPPLAAGPPPRPALRDAPRDLRSCFKSSGPSRRENSGASSATTSPRPLSARRHPRRRDRPRDRGAAPPIPGLRGRARAPRRRPRRPVRGGGGHSPHASDWGHRSGGKARAHRCRGKSGNGAPSAPGARPRPEDLRPRCRLPAARDPAAGGPRRARAAHATLLRSAGRPDHHPRRGRRQHRIFPFLRCGRG